MATEALTPEEILSFRDDAFSIYHKHVPFLEKVEKRCGSESRSNIEQMVNIELPRKLLEEES